MLSNFFVYCCSNMLLRMARLTDHADYDAGETSKNVPLPRSYSGNDDAYNRLRTRSTVSAPRRIEDNFTTLVVAVDVFKAEPPELA
ncbi:unnamed protein product [Protopolystoma xenopodis]|uniref:Uncharacterized protein n=1 Tax=Protopolystoma xenopodis TaxID=117903 RepID=A0A448WMH2_9PLAT|nr:unnamed protein product [Protopolystoma xenopodis]